MSIFRIISISTGICLTVSSIYAAQKVVGEKCDEDELSKGQNIAARVTTGFVTSVVIGGIVNSLVNAVYK